MGIPTRTDLAKWESPLTLFERAELARLQTGKLFCVTRNTGHVREAWVLAKIGTLLGASSCRLEDADPPDGFMRMGSRIVPVEVTVLLAPERRWGDEFKPGGRAHHKIRHVSEAEIDRAIDLNVKWLEGRIGAKIAKDDRYPPGTVLALYHNAGLWNFDPERTMDELEAASRLRSRNIIGSIILFDGALYGQDTMAKLRTQ